MALAWPDIVNVINLLFGPISVLEHRLHWPPAVIGEFVKEH